MDGHQSVFSGLDWLAYLRNSDSACANSIGYLTLPNLSRQYHHYAVELFRMYSSFRTISRVRVVTMSICWF